jgi:hypothetical protein
MFTILGLGSPTQTMQSAPMRMFITVVVTALMSTLLIVAAIAAIAMFHGTGNAIPMPAHRLYPLHSLLVDGGPNAICGGGVGTHC